MTLDETDHRLLALLQENADRTLTGLGEEVALSPSAVQRRITRYRKAGLLDRTVAVLDPAKVDALLAVVLVSFTKESSALHAGFRRAMLDAPEVQQCYKVSGDTDYVLMVATTGMAHYREFTNRHLVDAPNVQRYSTLFVLDPIRTGGVLPTRR